MTVEKLLEKVLELKLEISQTKKIKQDQRNSLKSDIEETIIALLETVGIECVEVEKALAFKLPNIESKTPKQYVPVKITVAIPSVDFDIDFEHTYLETERVRKAKEKEEEKVRKAKKIERDKASRELAKAQKQKAIENAT